MVTIVDFIRENGQILDAGILFMKVIIIKNYLVQSKISEKYVKLAEVPGDMWGIIHERGWGSPLDPNLKKKIHVHDEYTCRIGLNNIGWMPSNTQYIL